MSHHRARSVPFALIAVWVAAGCYRTVVPRDAAIDGGVDSPPTLTIDAVDLAAGGYHSCARGATGTVVCWGMNHMGQIGDGTFGGDRFAPVGVAGLSDAVEIAAGWEHNCARRAAGSVVCWGANPSGEIGDGTSGVDLVRPTPVLVSSLTDAVEIAAGSHHTCARRQAGSVVCWGWNPAGQIGDGTSGSNRLTPQRVSGLTDAVEIAGGGQHTCARRASGSVVCWGANSGGEAGDGSADNVRLTPVAVVGIADAVEITLGNTHTCARRASGSVVCWGRNLYGEIGDGSTTQRTTPAAVSGLHDAIEIAAGLDHTCARRVTGAVVCWGANVDGEVGDGTRGEGVTGARLSPVSVEGLDDAVEIAAGGYHTCARRAAGGVVCWGRNDVGQVGDGSGGNVRLTPVAVTGL